MGTSWGWVNPDSLLWSICVGGGAFLKFPNISSEVFVSEIGWDVCLVFVKWFFVFVFMFFYKKNNILIPEKNNILIPMSLLIFFGNWAQTVLIHKKKKTDIEINSNQYKFFLVSNKSVNEGTANKNSNTKPLTNNIPKRRKTKLKLKFQENLNIHHTVNNNRVSWLSFKKNWLNSYLQNWERENGYLMHGDNSGIKGK